MRVSNLSVIDSPDTSALRAALAHAERRLADIQALVGVGSWEYNRTTDTLWWSDEMFRLLGVPPEEAVAPELLVRCAHPEDAALAVGMCEATARGEMHDVEFRVVRPDGSHRVLRCVTHAHTIAGDDDQIDEEIIAGSMQDITERRQREQSLREIADRLELAMGLTEIGVFDHDVRAGRALISPTIAAIHGSPELTLTDAELMARVHPDDRGTLAAAIHRIADPGSAPVTSVVHRVIRPDGDVRWVQLRARRLGDADRAPSGGPRVIGVARDITDERAASASLELKDRAIEHALTPIAITNAAGRIEYVNAMFLKLWGYGSPDDVLGREPRDFAIPSDAAPPIAALVRQDAYQGEFIACRADGSTFPTLASVSGMRDERGDLTHLMTSFLDLSELKHLHQELLHAQRLESMGRLAGGVAHDFNNLLSVISNVTELVLEELPAGDVHTADLEQVRAAAQSATELTRQLLRFSRKQAVQAQPINTNGLLHHVGRLLDRLLGASITLRFALATDVPMVALDRTLAEQMLINLAVNARDAMPDGGVLTLGSAVVGAPAAWRAEHPDHPERPWVLLTVSDTGVGMSRDVQAKVFEPFFTTKEPGRGTGLGLSMVFGTVTQHGGVIEIDSAEGAGTTFRVYLPTICEFTDVSGHP